jgi:hypothetical protein
MKWVRSKIKFGSLLALLALVLQFAVSFGHFHPTAARAVQGAAQSAQQPSPGGPDSDQQTSDACEVCALIALASTGLFAAPPLLSLPQGSEFSRLTIDAGFAHLSAARVAFQPRAPPLS